MFCQNCGQPQLPGFSFCSRCGCRLIKPEFKAVPVADTPAAEPLTPVPTPADAVCNQSADTALAETAAEETEVQIISDETAARESANPDSPEVASLETPLDSGELLEEDPAAIPAESGTYVPPVQPYPGAPYPQYGYGYYGTAPQSPPYPYYGVPAPQYPQYPQMPGASYASNPYVPYNAFPAYPAYPGMPQQPGPAPVPEDKDVPPAKQGRRRVPLIIMALLVIAGLLLFFFGRGKAVSPSQNDTAQSQSETPWFRNEDGTLYFDAELYNGPSELTIPETVNGEPVICIAQDCFAGNDTITTVILPDTLEEIGSGAFAECTAMRGIFIPEGTKLIGSGAFKDCSSLEAIHIPSSVAAIGRNTFRGCSGLKYIMYDGTYEEWYDLYASYIAGETKVYCSDGTFPQGRIIP